MESSNFLESKISNSDSVQYYLKRLNSTLLRDKAVVAEATEESISKFCSLEEISQLRILRNISKYIQILSVEPEPERENWHRKELEIARLKKAAKAFGLRFLDDEIFNLIDGEDVIEIYDQRQIQIYRNVKFCKICSYSLLDLAVHSWAELYEKPAFVAAAAGAKVQEVMTADKTLSYDIEPFIQREVLIYAKTRRTFLVKPKYLSPLVSEMNGRIAGFVTTFSAEVLADGDESNKFSII